MSYQHTSLAAGKWEQLSLAEQLGNIGSEVSRAERQQDKNPEIFQHTVIRALELFDLTLHDKRWRHRAKEICRAREIFCDAVSGGHQYQSTLRDLNRYFLYFALSARSNR